MIDSDFPLVIFAVDLLISAVGGMSVDTTMMYGGGSWERGLINTASHTVYQSYQYSMYSCISHSATSNTYTDAMCYGL